MKKSVEVHRLINASRDRIWKVITNTNMLQSEGTGITKIEGDIAAGQKLKLFSEVSPDRAFSLKVSEFEQGKRMLWEGGMPLGLFTGRRQFILAERDEQTEFHMREEFTGPMSGMIWKSMPDLQPSFDKLADAVKAMAENGKEAA